MKKRILIFLTAIFVILTGCGNNNNNNNNEKETEIKTENTTENTTEEKETVNNDKTVKTEKLNLEDYSLEYNVKTDSVRGAYWGVMTESENGYFLTDINQLKYWDKESGIYLPLCSNPDCLHEDLNCVAFLDQKKDILFMSIKPCYYSGYIYIAGLEDNGYVNLYRIKEDGSTFEKYIQLYKIEDTSNFYDPEIVIHRNKIYYTIPWAKEYEIFAYDMESDTTDVVFTMTGERQDLYRMLAYGDYLFFQAGNFVDEKMLDIEGGIYALNVNTNEIIYVLDNAFANYGIHGNKLYYMQNGKILVLDLVDYTTEQFCELGEDEQFICGEENIVIFETYNINNINAYDNDNLLTQSHAGWFRGNIGKYVFAEETKGEETFTIYYDTTKQEEWKRLK